VIRYTVIAHKIADAITSMYPDIQCDDESLPFFIDVSRAVETLFNKLPLKAKNLLAECTIYLSSSENIHKVTKDDVKVLGITRPADCIIILNVERFTDGENKLSEERFESLFYHELGHYMAHHFTEKDKAFYYKLFGNEPQMVGEPEADGFAVYMLGAAPYHVQEFWSWWAANDL
jgi:hypothetical protein